MSTVVSMTPAAIMAASSSTSPIWVSYISARWASTATTCMPFSSSGLSSSVSSTALMSAATTPTGSPSAPRMGWAMIHSMSSPCLTNDVSTGSPELTVSNHPRPRAWNVLPGLLEARTFPFRSVISMKL